MQKLLRPLVLAALLLATAGVASADTACVDWSCDDSTAVCSFDLSCSSASPFIWKYKLDFGDGTSTGWIGSTMITHTYVLPTYAYPVVTLTIQPWSDNPQTQVTCQVIVRNYVGPPLPLAGRCSVSS